MSVSEIEKAYEETAKKINNMLREDEERAKEVEAEIEKLRGEREIERRVWERVMGQSGRG